MRHNGLTVVFCLPNAGHIPVGGHKVVYEYANHLARMGHTVHLIHPAIYRIDSSPLRRVIRSGRFVLRQVTGSYHPQWWFRLHPAVRVHWVPSLAERHVPDADVVIATGWQTAEWAVDYSAKKGRKFYLIQSDEVWSGPEARVKATWQMPFEKIVISRWLLDLAKERGVDATLIANGLDAETFGMDIPPEQRQRPTAMAMYSRVTFKGSADVLAVATAVHQQIPEFRLTLFGVPRAPRLPDWIDYHRFPDQKLLRKLYNSAAVFVSASKLEGWALPPAEAMQCGAALVLSDIGGHRDYAVGSETALLFPPGDRRVMEQRLLDALREPDLRARLARAGNVFARRFTWERSTQSLVDLLANDSKP